MHNVCTCHDICTDQRTTSDTWVPWMYLKLSDLATKPLSRELPCGYTNFTQV